MAANPASIDAIDREILRVLADDARIGWSELGARVRLSPNAAAERVRKLVRAGVIRRFTTDIDQAAFGRTLQAVIDVRVAGGNRFHDVLTERDEVTWLAHVTGRTDYQVHVSCAGTEGLQRLLTSFRDDYGAVETLTTVVLESYRPAR
ncbi:MAG: Lrp/AsnC family transcriptional regulator [Ilumatobacteraceae bacterium]|jgi:Lrp/AsnC family leucine-responsive transcriptional regulator